MDNREIRLLNLKYAIAKYGGIGAVAEMAECSKKYLEQIVQGFQGPKDKSPRKVGDAIAARIAAALGEEPYWMDQPHADLWEEYEVTLEKPQIAQSYQMEEPSGVQYLIELDAPRAVQVSERKKPKKVGSIRIPVLDVSTSAGHGGEPVDFPAVLDYLEVAEGWAARHFGTSLGAVRVVSVAGDSMNPTLKDGDLAFVDTKITTFDREGIYVIMFDGRLLIKRLRANLSSRLVEICSDNERAYPVQTIHPNELERLHIVGAVRAWWSLQNG